MLLRQLHGDEHLSNGEPRGGPPSLRGLRGPRARGGGGERRAPRPAPRFPPGAAASAAPPIYGERYQGGKWRLRSPRSPGVITFTHTHTPVRTHSLTLAHGRAAGPANFSRSQKNCIYIYKYINISPSLRSTLFPPPLVFKGWVGALKMLLGLGSQEAARGGRGRFC